MSTPRRNLQTSFTQAGRRQLSLEEAAEERGALGEAGLAITPAEYAKKKAREEAPAPSPKPLPTAQVPKLTAEIPPFMFPTPPPRTPPPEFVPAHRLPPPEPQRRLMEGRPEVPVEMVPITHVPASITHTWGPPPGFVLRPDQQRAVDVFLQNRRGTIVGPTGVGKTAQIIAMIIALKVPSVVFVDSKVLSSQWEVELRRWGITPGVYSGEEKRPGFVTVALYQSLYQNPELVRNFPALFFDEGDKVTGDVWRRILEEARRHPYALVTSATLPRNPERLAQLERTLPILIQEGPAQHIAAGNLVRAVPHRISVPLTSSERVEYDDLSEKMRKLAGALGTADVSSIARRAQYSESEEMRRMAATYLSLFVRRKAIAANAERKYPALVTLVQQHQLKKMLIFSTTVEAAEQACVAVNRVMMGVSTEPYCRVISGETARDEREYILRNFGQTFYLLSSVGVLSRGFNVPDVAIEVFMSAGSSRGELTQKMGRALRPYPGKDHADIYVMTAEGTTDSRVYDTIRSLVGVP